MIAESPTPLPESPRGYRTVKQLSEEDPTESKVEISEEVAAFTNVNQEELENFNVPYLEGLPDSTSDLQSRQVLAVGIPLPESPKEKRKESRLFVPSEDEDERAIDLSRKESPKERTFNVMASTSECDETSVPEIQFSLQVSLETNETNEPEVQPEIIIDPHSADEETRDRERVIQIRKEWFDHVRGSKDNPSQAPAKPKTKKQKQV